MSTLKIDDLHVSIDTEAGRVEILKGRHPHVEQGGDPRDYGS